MKLTNSKSVIMGLGLTINQPMVVVLILSSCKILDDIASLYSVEKLNGLGGIVIPMTVSLFSSIIEIRLISIHVASEGKGD